MSLRVSNCLIANGFPSQTSSTSGVIWANDIVRISALVTVGSGSLSGTFQLQASNDQAVGAFPNQFLPTNWVSLGSTSQVVASNTVQGSGVFLIPAVEVSYEYLRVQYTSTSSGGSGAGLYSIRTKSLGF